VRERQQAREEADPERKSLREKMERRSRAKLHYQSANEQIVNNGATSKAWTQGLSEYRVAERGSAEVRRQTVHGAVDRMGRLQGLAKRSKARSKARSRAAATPVVDDVVQASIEDAMSDEDNEVYAALSAEMALPAAAEMPVAMVATPFGAARQVDVMADLVTPAAPTEVSDALAQLRVEPRDDEGKAELFKLYEASASTVEENRTGLFEFWAEVEADFATHPAVQRQLCRKIDAIDAAENNGLIQSPPGVWFVHGMAVQAAKNVSMLDRVLRDIRGKLELLGAQEECPICLEPLTAIEGGVISLGCAHQVCTACWDRWTTMSPSRGNATCPLCRNQAFVSEIYAVADALLED